MSKKELARLEVVQRVADGQDAHAPCPGDDTALAHVCAIHHRRKLSKDLVVSFNRQRYIVQTEDAPRFALRGQAVTVIEYRIAASSC